jgi:nickel/cobalt transporter (NicO) family protein
MFRGSWLLACLAFAVFASLIPREAQAHPLGNFTINHYSRLEFADEKARIDFVLDFAEIPTFQQKGKLDPNEDSKLSDAEARAYLDAKLPSLVEKLHLRVGKEDLLLRVLHSSAEYRPGQGGLPILRIEARLLADLPEDWEDHGVGHYTDRTYENRLGWREIVVKGGPGVAIKGSTAPSSGVSDELRKYPSDMLSSPLDVREATFTLVPGEESFADGPVGEAARNYSTSEYSFKSNGYISKIYTRLNSLISFTSPSPTVILISLLSALLWGALHAFTPGHGKTIVAAYLIGGRGTARHAAFLGLTVTLTHTLGVFALGGVAMYMSRYILPEALFPWLSVVSGLLVVVIGLSLLFSRSRGLFGTGSGKARHTKLRHADGPHTDSHDDHSYAYAHVAHSHSHGGHEHSREHVHSAHSHGDHEHTHSHGGHTHSHLPLGADGSKAGIRSLVALGVSGGLVPCPAALVLLLSAISLGRLGFGMVLVVAFSVGLAIVLTGIGILMIYAKRLFDRFSFEARVPRLLPVASALVISLAGVAILVGSLKQAGIV